MATRKRASGGAAATRAAKIARLAHMLAVSGQVPAPVRGYDRTGGYYGRFSGPNAELKFFDTALSFSFDSTGEVPATGQLTLIPQGVTESTRVGRKAVIKEIRLKGQAVFEPGAAGDLSFDTVHLYLVLDKQCNGAAAGATDVLSSTAFATAFRNLANEGRFVILKEWHRKVVSQSGATTAFGQDGFYIDFTKRCNIPIEYSSTTGAITEIRSNNLFLLAGGTQSDDLVAFTGNCRLRFSDQ